MPSAIDSSKTTATNAPVSTLVNNAVMLVSASNVPLMSALVTMASLDVNVKFPVSFLSLFRL